MATMKCGRETYVLVDGDTVMGNGSCLQLITRTIMKGWQTYHPIVSKKAFSEFKANKNVGINNGHEYGSRVTLWTYTEQANEHQHQQNEPI